MGDLRVQPSRSLEDVDPADMAVFILPGGDRWESSPLEPELAALLRRLDAAGVPVAAICMSQVISASVVACLLAACTGAGNPHAAAAGAPRLVIQAARLLDPASGADRRDMVVVVEGSRIAEVESASRYRPRPEDRRVNLGQATLLPGLIDAHVHLSIGGPPRAAAVATVRAGFTTVADLGAVSQRIQVVRDSIAAGAWEGPRVLAAGLWIGVKDGVCEFGGIGVAGGPDAFRVRVRENVAAGADLIKACVTGWPAVAWAHPDSAELGPEILTALVDEAHRAGRPVVAHALSAEGVRRALDAGVDGLVHAAYVDESLANRMRERGLWLSPTLASLTRGDSTPPARGLVEAVGMLSRSGVTLVYGTDGGVLPHGRNAEEAIALTAAGIPPTEILRAATVNAAKALGLADSVGAIRRGMVADLIAVPGDPRADLRVLERPSFVMARGRVLVGEGAHQDQPAPSPSLSRRQRQIMDVIYRLGKASATDIHAALPDAPRPPRVRFPAEFDGYVARVLRYGRVR